MTTGGSLTILILTMSLIASLHRLGHWGAGVVVILVVGERVVLGVVVGGEELY